MSAEREIRADPSWGLLATYCVNLLDVPTHQHGPSGQAFVPYKDAVELLHFCIEAHEAKP